ncbi:hypothetical protein OGATHE_005313 [Ogataea polymorpha]|uniref:Uncharacterized protein n=1 Tax=Ogataea polymorpha TaxID=460523 RepID=A0A9P8T0U4_9ASCO|nr:hypothetical protein OGATHE_005313 [Ogataea polymorpha]
MLPSESPVASLVLSGDKEATNIGEPLSTIRESSDHRIVSTGERCSAIINLIEPLESHRRSSPFSDAVINVLPLGLQEIETVSLQDGGCGSGCDCGIRALLESSQVRLHIIEVESRCPQANMFGCWGCQLLARLAGKTKLFFSTTVKSLSSSILPFFAINGTGCEVLLAIAEVGSILRSSTPSDDWDIEFKRLKFMFMISSEAISPPF